MIRFLCLLWMWKKREGLFLGCWVYGAGDDETISALQQSSNLELDPCSAITSTGHGACKI